jgi:hypothetical protein
MHQYKAARRGTKATRALRRQSAWRVSLGTIALLLFLGVAQPALATEPLELVKGATGPTGPTGPEGKTGPTGPAGSGGGGGGGITREECSEQAVAPKRISCQLKNLGTETGTWSASISVPASGRQQQSNGVVSFPIQYPGEPATLSAYYKTEVNNVKLENGCLGSVDEPTAEPGKLCIQRGNAPPKETTDLNASFKGFFNPVGEGGLIATNPTPTFSGEVDATRTGLMVVFRTATFNEATPEKVAAESGLIASGSWAVTAN